MMKFFNTAGPVNKDIHYKIDPLTRWKLDEILTLIKQQKYFLLHSPRQTGKTSCMLALQEHLNAANDYVAIYANFESGQASRNDIAVGLNGILFELISRSARVLGQKLPFTAKSMLNDAGPTDALNAALQALCAFSEKPVVLFIDEIDSLIGDTLISVLRQLRAGYDSRPEHFPISIMLCGVRDIQDYRIHRADKEIITGGSAFNIKAESLTLGNFSQTETIKLLNEHTKETGQQFAKGVAEYIHDQTGGQPWLVNAVAYEVTFKMEENRDPKVVITEDKVREAINRVIVSKATHIDQLAHKLSEPRVHRVILPIILGESIEANEDDLSYCVDLGLIKNSDVGYIISNPIYREVIPRELSTVRQAAFKTHFSPQWIREDNSLDTDKLFELFTDFWRENSEIWGTKIAGYEEAAPHLVFQAFLQRVANGAGYVRREYALGRKRTDLYLEWHGGDKVAPKKQRVIIELKIMRKKDKLETLKQTAIAQTAEYSKRCNGTENHILIFDRDETTDWHEKVFKETVQHDGMTFKIWGV